MLSQPFGLKTKSRGCVMNSRLCVSLPVCLVLVVARPVPAADEQPAVTGVRAVHRDGQTFVTWADVAEGEAGAKFRYTLYRHTEPITAENLARAEVCGRGILNNSAKLYGSAFSAKARLDPAKPYTVIEEGGKPLPPWSGLAVDTIRKAGKAYYAVVATDDKGESRSKLCATKDPVEEKPAPIQAIKLYDSKERKGPYVANTSVTGKKGLPLHVTLHGSQSTGGGAGEYGDYYLFFGTRDMGFRDGLPGVFSVEEHRGKDGNRLLLRVRDAVEHPRGGAMETYWFGHTCVPQWADHADPRFYPFTEARLLWTVEWVVKKYGADPERVTVGGSSSGAVGSMNVGFRHPELFAAAFPSVGRVRKVPAVSLEKPLPKGARLLMADGKTDYLDRADGPKFAAGHAGDLPFLGWACGRNDGYATWQEHIDMVKTMTDAKHGFAFAWNNGGHSEGGRAMQQIDRYYPAAKFARDKSYPAFGNSSVNDDMGTGDPKDGDLEGGINLGFDWKDVRDEEGKWSARLSNALAKKDMTADVTPRRGQKFRPKPGDKFTWTDSHGNTGAAVADKNGLVTVTAVKIKPGAETTLTIER
jgi:poly(3-hydroxybutyrate) depolymerase